MSFTVFDSVLALGLFLGMLIFLLLGRWIGIRRISMDPEGAHIGVGAIEGAVFALLGLLVAFTFSGAASRLDARRQLIVEEANAIGTAYLRLELLPEESRRQLRESFRAYVDTRLDLYRKYKDAKAAQENVAGTAALQGAIWTRAEAACRAEGSQAATMLILPALNQMIDITTTRAMAAQMHPPMIIYAMLFVLALVSALIAGYGMGGQKKPSWIHIIGFSAVIALTVFVILDLEYPRMGFIRLDQADQVLLELRRGIQ